MVRSRADVVATLEDAGLEVPRQSRSYVTACDPETGKRWRLKGALFASMTWTPNDLTARLQRRLENERRQIEETAASELRRLGESLRSIASGALRSIEADTAAWTGRMRGLLTRGWLRPLVVGMSLSLGICGGSWAAMHWLATSIQHRMETWAAVNVEIERAHETLAEIEKATMGRLGDCKRDDAQPGRGRRPERDGRGTTMTPRLVVGEDLRPCRRRLLPASPRGGRGRRSGNSLL